MNAKHTPGPWEVEEYDGYMGYDCMSGGMRCAPMVVLDASDYPEHPDRDTPPERMLADAHLISSTPDLLEALSNLVNQADSHGLEGVFWDQARAAIAKAYGESK